MFRNAIVRTPCRSVTDGITTANLGKPDYLLALEQHKKYIEALRLAGINVMVLDASDQYPDSTFIEDVALCTSACAIITRPGASERRGETTGMADVLKSYYDVVEEILYPGTIEAGDIMMAGTHYYIGISGRTNREGADQLMSILKKYKFTASQIPLKKLLHLKSGVSYLENGCLLVSKDLYKNEEFEVYKKIVIDDDERYAANSLWINGTVLVPENFPGTREKIEKAGYKTTTLDVSEFRKLDGGLSCLSLRF